VHNHGLLFACILAAGCGSSSDQLTGSLSSVYDLSFDKVVVSELQQTLIVEYNRTSGSDPGTVIKFTADLSGVTLAPAQPVDLTTLVNMQPRGSLQRLVDSPIALGIERGTLTLDESTLTGGQNASGQFNVELSNPNGYTLTGKFSEKLTVLQ
jgi:hypothetical protein